MKSRGIKTKHRLVARLEGEILKHIRHHHGLARIELARELHLAPSTVGIYVDRLVQEGVLLETARTSRGRGRPSQLLAPNPRAGQFVGVDFEARSVMATSVDFSQQPLRRSHRTLRRGDGVERVLENITAAITELLAADRRPVLGIGVGVPGPIDPAGGIALAYEHIPGWRGIPLAARLREHFGVPVHLENNIRSIALAELWFGLGRGVRDFICLGVRSGLGAGIVANGQLLHGHHFQAGEIGRWLGSPSLGGVPATSLEDTASLSSLLRSLRTPGQRTEPTIDHLLRACRAGDARAVESVTRAACVHGWAAHQLLRLLDPEKIILAGPLTALGDAYVAPLKQTLRELAADGPLPVVVASTLGEYNGALGAAALALHQWEPVRTPA